MAQWWVYLSQDTLPSYDSLTVVSQTTEPAHLFMVWDYVAPVNVPIYKTIRGEKILCGYRYRWTKIHLVEQSEYGADTTHTFRAADLAQGSTIWFYVFFPTGPYGKQLQGPLTSIALPILGNWVQLAYVATARFGVYRTYNFCVNKNSPAGVPTWSTVNEGLPDNIQFLAFQGDPFNPSGRQYFLNDDALYRRTTGPWQSILSRAALIDYTDANDVPATRFAANALQVNTNTPGWVAVIFVGQHSTNGDTTHLLYFCLSTDYGNSWAIAIAENGTLNLPYPACLTVGGHQGASPYPPGRVIYFMARKAYTAYCLRSIDGGFTWNSFVIGPTVSHTTELTYEGHMLVNPNTQDTCFFTGCIDLAGTYRLRRSADHGETWPYFDSLATHKLGARISYLATNTTLSQLTRVGTERGRLMFYRTNDAGASWNSTTPPVHSPHLVLMTVPGEQQSLYIAGHYYDDEMNYQTIWASEDEGATLYAKSGAHPDTPDTGGGDSIPYNAWGIRAILPILTGLT